MPFDRLVGAVDRWARERERDDVFAQTAETETPPQHIAHARFLSPREYDERVAKATLLIAHAGMGSILTALELGKPIVVMPRRGDLAETRNDHQVATAKAFAERGSVRAVYNDDELIRVLDDPETLSRPETIESHAPRAFLESLRAYALGETR